MYRRHVRQYMLMCFIAAVLLLQGIRLLMPPNLTRGSDCLEKHYYPQVFQSVRNHGNSDNAKAPPDDHQVPFCDVVHIATRCYGEQEMYNLTLLVKSILYFTRSAVKFHIVTDKATEHVLRIFMDSWELQHVAVQYYTSKRARVIDYFVHQPPASIEQLLIIKPYVMLFSDITHFWQLAKTNKSQHFIIRGISSHRSTLRESAEFPAKQKVIFHSIEAVILNLKELRQKALCPTIAATPIDQITPDYRFIFLLECKSFLKKGEYQEPNLSEIPKIIQTGIIDPTQLDAHFLPEMYQSVIQLPGDTLRNRLVDESCAWIYTRPVVQKEMLDDYCYEYRYQACITRRVHLYFNGLNSSAIFAPIDYKNHDVTMVTQLQYNRLPGLPTLIDSWPGPLQVVMYLSDAEAQLFREDIIQYSQLSRSRVHVHVVYKRQLYYPINMLRNIGIRETKTDHLFVVDVDFVPMLGLHRYFLSIIQYLEEQNKHKRAIIVPTFETFNSDYIVPSNKKDFIRDVHLGRVEPYHQGTFWSFKDGHKPHNYPKWFDATSPYKVDWVSKFEPYVMMPTRDSPLYEEMLVECMRDKMLYNLEIALKGYTFFVLHDAYMVHFPHEQSVSHSWTRDSKFYRCASYFYENLKEKLMKKYSSNNRKQSKADDNPS